VFDRVNDYPWSALDGASSSSPGEDCNPSTPPPTPSTA
jgi:hypothetical protein